MLTLFRNLFKKLLYDELAVRRWARSFLIGAGVVGVGVGDQIAQLFGSPESATKIKVGIGLLAAIGGAVTAGQRNPVADQPSEQPPA